MRLVFFSARQRRINCEEVDSGGLGMTFEFNKRAELFVGTHDKAPSIGRGVRLRSRSISSVNLDLGKIWLRSDDVSVAAFDPESVRHSYFTNLDPKATGNAMVTLEQLPNDQGGAVIFALQLVGKRR